MSKLFPDDTCLNCFFIETESSGLWYECRFNAPIVSPIGNTYQWPRINPTDWCANGIQATNKIKYQPVGVNKP